MQSSGAQDTLGLDREMEQAIEHIVSGQVPGISVANGDRKQGHHYCPRYCGRIYWPGDVLDFQGMVQKPPHHRITGCYWHCDYRCPGLGIHNIRLGRTECNR